ncbi:MAG TPA: YchJ family protein [Coxiellaceae bacterium]|nr:YchJ family protein [Coxiellaceae bacterium]
MSTHLCPCCSGQAYQSCCALFIEQKQLPETAEQLMRSRYTAFSQANIEYIEKTMRGAAAATQDIEKTKAWAEQVSWEGLEVLGTQTESAHPNKAIVEFNARYRLHDQAQVLHERSLFEYLDDRWFYVGEAPYRNNLQIGRNDPCHCGSGKKYKKCCLN